VVAVTPDRPATLRHPVDGSGHPDREAAHTTLEPRRRIRFHQQMQMIPLNAELKNAKP
jgi:hypothetical protein